MPEMRDVAFGYRRIVSLLVALVVVPTFLLLAVGVILLFLEEAKVNLLMGILVMALRHADVVSNASNTGCFVRPRSR